MSICHNPQADLCCLWSCTDIRDNVKDWQNWRNAFRAKYNLCTDGTAAQIPVVTYSNCCVIITLRILNEFQLHVPHRSYCNFPNNVLILTLHIKYASSQVPI